MKPAIPDHLYPFRSHFLDRGGLRYHYLDEGQGDSLVMVHGNPSWSFLFRDLVLGLRDEYRAIVPDHIGCGHSDKPGDERYEYVLERRIDDLEALLESLSLDGKVTLVLHDWGGAIGMGWAARHPERVGRLVILNTGAFHMPAGKRLPLSLRLVRDTPLGPLLVRGFNAFSVGATRLCVRRPMSREVAAAYRAPYDSWANRIATLRFVQDIPLRPADRSYGLVSEIAASLERFRDVPATICWGMRDFVFDRHFLEEWQRRLPEAAVHRFENAGHYVLEDAGTEILDQVRRFLESHPLR